MRILILDASPALQQLCITHLAARWPGATVELADSTNQNTRQPETPVSGDSQQFGQQFDAILLAHHAAGGTGIAWLRQRRLAEPAPPPTILLSDEDGQDVAVQAMKLGAADFMHQDRMTAERLIGAVSEAILERAREHDRVLAQARLAERYADTITLKLNLEAIGEVLPADAPRIGGYRMLRKIGEGGTAGVFLAERLPRLGHPPPVPRQVVLKVLDARHMNDAFIERFIREYRIISGVQNEHVARIFDQGITDDHLYIAMEYFAAGDLKSRIDRGRAPGGTPLTSMQSLKIVLQIARALDAIHAAGVIHRDLKPHNILFRDSGRLALVDFGLAKQMGEKTITASGAIMATPLYMSPEQCLGRAPDIRSDLYSLGVMLYEMFTGQRPFESENLATVVFSHVHGEVPRLPAPLAGYQALMDKLLAKNPDDRFQSARELYGHIAY